MYKQPVYSPVRMDLNHKKQFRKESKQELDFLL